MDIVTSIEHMVLFFRIQVKIQPFLILIVKIIKND